MTQNAARAARRGHMLTVVLAVGVAGAWLLAWLAGAGALPSTQGSYNVKVVAPSAAGLGSGANVTIAGLKVGRVASIERRGAHAVLSLELRADRGPVPADSRFGVRLRSLVGENYVELYPGRAKIDLPDGGTLLPGAADDYVDVDQILDTLRGRTRASARRTIRAVGAGLDGRGEELNRVVGGVAGTITDAGPVLGLLARDRRQLARVTDEFGKIAAAVGARGGDISRLAVGFRRTFGAIASRDAALRSTLEALPDTLIQIRRTTGILQTVSADSAPVVSNLASAIRDLGPALGLLRPAADDGRALVHELSAATPPLVQVLGGLERLAGPTARSLPRLGSLLCQVNPMAEYLKPYSKDLAGILQAMGSTTNFYDANGHAARLFASVGANSLKFLTPEASRVVTKLLDQGVIGKVHQLGYNPFPKPGEAAETADSTSPRGMDDVKAPYPRVKADC